MNGTVESKAETVRIEALKAVSTDCVHDWHEVSHLQVTSMDPAWLGEMYPLGMARIGRRPGQLHIVGAERVVWCKICGVLQIQQCDVYESTRGSVIQPGTIKSEYRPSKGDVREL